MIRAHLDPALTARVVARRPLCYRGGAAPERDRPGHVRAASALAWLGDRLVVVQDDALFLGVVDVATGLVDPIDLPAGADGRRLFDAGRGNKAAKLDLEAAFVALHGGRPTLVALGSGGTLAVRRVAVTLTLGAAGPEVLVRAIDALVAAIAAAAVPAGASLNLEGAIACGDRLVVANRGNDTAADGRLVDNTLVAVPLAALWAALDGAIDGDGAAGIAGVVPVVDAYDLGDLPDLAGCRLSFTDLADLGAGVVGYLAAAEDTCNYFDDGAVAGSVVGRLAAGPGSAARHAVVTDEHGARLAIKLEGLAAVPGRPDRLLAVADPDDPDRPGELVELAVAGPW